MIDNAIPAAAKTENLMHDLVLVSQLSVFREACMLLCVVVIDNGRPKPNSLLSHRSAAESPC